MDAVFLCLQYSCFGMNMVGVKWVRGGCEKSGMRDKESGMVVVALQNIWRRLFDNFMAATQC